MKTRAFSSQDVFYTFFLKVFSDSQKWTFINVQNPKPFWTFVLILLLKNTTKIIYITVRAYMIIVQK
jgi:hypothetical protein